MLGYTVPLVPPLASVSPLSIFGRYLGLRSQYFAVSLFVLTLPYEHRTG